MCDNVTFRFREPFVLLEIPINSCLRIFPHSIVDNVDNPAFKRSTHSFKKTYRARSSYTALYRFLVLRHRIGGKNLYR